ncbi:DUF2190 family protein [Frigoribacterium sp. CG_9.8]|uniref:DUF2190 family protein n=1 Tax=Frigoribacterium sp. CG_9.8 TaxID=2787733 RepID=UPI0018C9D950|nr:DUF2190 family protein [Frigoribacterium sp. CG_9.8]MBG6106554.1 hypothetical protein [Frigoribacterium sp. CG_9.8]
MGAQVFADIESTREVWTLAVPTLPRVAVMQGTRPGVTLSGTPGQKTSITVAGITISGLPQGDNGQGALESSVYTTGTFEFPITGAVAGTVPGVPVYFVAADGTLSITATGNTYFGVVNEPSGYLVRGTVRPIKIGVTA